MSKVITFSRVFPAYHPKAGQPTCFVEQLWNSITELGLPHIKIKDLPNDFMWSILPLSNYGCKFHTIRAGNRWKAGDKFSPRVWGSDINPISGKSGPYQSKQIIIAPDIEIKKVWDFEVDLNYVKISNQMFTVYDFVMSTCGDIANNDGLSGDDFLSWFRFPKPFTGQIICWSDKIKY